MDDILGFSYCVEQEQELLSLGHGFLKYTGRLTQCSGTRCDSTCKNKEMDNILY